MPDGIIVVDKPVGWTSMDVCAKLRGVFGERRVGHAGTLDPLATGVLPVFVGRATRAVEFAESGLKIYETVLRLGTETDTQDITGTVLNERSVSVDRAALESVLLHFIGEITQVPPMYSALKRNGKKLCDLARSGVSVEREARNITIFVLKAGRQLSDTDWELHIECSKGTYVRTLCHDIGAALGCGGVMASLRRTKAAGFDLSEAVTMERILLARERGEQNSLLQPVDRIFAAIPAVFISGESERRCRNGNPFSDPGPDGTFRVYGADGSFLMLGRRDCGEMKTVKSFFPVS